ncbi:MAG: hypothetical protein M0026_20250 [Nocardiopsaceae bacterium]|nr:hypothetical protein [Nocardiopsaceae bacterium]
MRPVRSALQGAIAGAAATVAMSAFVEVGRRSGTIGRHPPKLITRTLLPSGFPSRPRRGEDAATTAVHLGIGMSAGAVFGLLTGQRRPRRISGALYGLAVWLAGYEGWAPVIGAQPPAHRDAPGRAWTMAAAHVVYGMVLAGTLRVLRGRRPVVEADASD